MTKFAKPKPRYDYTTANEGIWIYPEDENGTVYGGFRVGLFNVALPRVRQTIERHQRMNNAAQRQRRSESKREAVARQEASIFVECCLLDWDMKDEKGKPVVFSHDLAVEYFLTSEINPGGEKEYVYNFVLAELVTKAQDVTVFQSDEQVEAGDPLGN